MKQYISCDKCANNGNCFLQHCSLWMRFHFDVCPEDKDAKPEDMSPEMREACEMEAAAKKQAKRIVARMVREAEEKARQEQKRTRPTVDLTIVNPSLN